MTKPIQISITIETEDIDGHMLEVATAHVLGTGVQGVVRIIGGGADTETKAAEAGRAAIRKYREIIGNDTDDEISNPTILIGDFGLGGPGAR